MKTQKKFSSLLEVQKEGQNMNRYLYVYRGTVYDLTDFLSYHPGGRSPLNVHKGKDLENILFNPQLHMHSRSVLETMLQYKYGIIVQPTMVNSKSTNITNSGKGTIIKSITNSTTKQSQSQIMQRPSKSLHQKPKKEDQSERLNQSFSRLNQSMTSSQRSQFLMIPNQQDIIKIQKQKQQKLMQQWKDSELAEYKRQQTLVKNGVEDSTRRAQSEIITTSRNKPVNTFYQQWLDNQRKQQSNENNQISTSPSLAQVQTKKQNDLPCRTQSLEVQPNRSKKVNPYYEEWKRKQQQNKLCESIIVEENESQISPSPSSINNSFQRSYSQMSSRTLAQEDPHLQVPTFQAKLMSPLKCKFFKKQSQ